MYQEEICMPHDQVIILVGPRIIASFGRNMQMIFDAQVQMQSPSFSGGPLPASSLRHTFKPRRVDRDLHGKFYTVRPNNLARDTFRASS